MCGEIDTRVSYIDMHHVCIHAVGVYSAYRVYLLCIGACIVWNCVCITCLSCFYVVCICLVLGQCFICIIGLCVYGASVYIICVISIERVAHAL